MPRILHVNRETGATEFLEVGHWIKFRSATRWSDRLVWRKINGFTADGRPTVRFDWPDFAVRHDEIVEVNKHRPVSRMGRRRR